MARRVLLAFTAAWLASVPEMRAQSSSPSVGFWMGAEYVPGGLDPVCAHWDDARGMPNVGAFVAVPTGPVVVEGRVGGYFRGASPICDLELHYPLVPGTRTERTSLLPTGNFAAVDLRIRWLPTFSRAVHVAVGGGWAGAAKDVPYLDASLGARWPAGGMHVGVDVELRAYRLPWLERTVEMSEDFVETEILRRRFEEWAPAMGVRFWLEIPMQR
jgi:hypothetical protein